jgi:hypothetical protein
MNKFLSFVVLVLSAGVAYAGESVVQAPEIDAMAGLAAIGAVGAVASLIWERRRR